MELSADCENNVEKTVDLFKRFLWIIKKIVEKSKWKSALSLARHFYILVAQNLDTFTASSGAEGFFFRESCSVLYKYTLHSTIS